MPPFIQLPDFQFTKCCDLHDTCYMTCGVSKEFCEKEFEKCLKSHCKKQYKGNGECKSTADTYTMGVKMFGCVGYQGSQADSCECMSASSVAEQNFAEYAHAFYAKYNGTHPLPEAMVAKHLHPGSKTQGELLFRLYQRYPEAIEIIARDGQAQRSKPTYWQPLHKAASEAAPPPHHADEL